MTLEAIEIVRCHAEGEVGDVIIGGVEPPPGETIWEQSRWIEADQRLRNLVLQEPRGGVFRHVNLLVPPIHPEADAGFIIMEPMHTPPMSGSNSMCVATVLLDTGMIAMHEPITELILEAPAGLVRVRAECRNGKAERVTITNVPSFAGQLDVALDVSSIDELEANELRVDTAYGGDTFVMVAAADIGLSIVPENARALAELGARLVTAATEQLGFEHPTNPEWSHISFCQIHEKPRHGASVITMKSTTVVEPGKLDRSPTGTGVSARLAVMHARGEIGVGEPFVMRSVIDSEFVGEIVAETDVAGRAAIVPTVSGRAWITGRSTLTVHPDDPWPTGYRLSDTWPS